MRIVLRLCIFTAVSLASGALPALSDEYAAFGNGPAGFIMMPDELSTWKALKDDVEAREFIERFWARRDPAYHALFDQAVAYADRTLGMSRTKHGSLSDMGRVLVIMGPPTRQRQYEAPVAAIPSAIDDSRPNETRLRGMPNLDKRSFGSGRTRCWVYEPRRLTTVREFDAVEICFEKVDGEYSLEGESTLRSTFEQVNRSRLLIDGKPGIQPDWKPFETN